MADETKNEKRVLEQEAIYNGKGKDSNTTINNLPKTWTRYGLIGKSDNLFAYSNLANIIKQLINIRTR